MRSIVRGAIGAALLSIAFGCSSGPAHAQALRTPTSICDPKYPDRCLAPQPDGSLNVNAAVSVSASISGFTPNGNKGTPVSATTSSSRQQLPGASSVVMIGNTGAVPVFVHIGDSSVTASVDDLMVPAGGGCALTVGSNTYIAGITSSGSATLNTTGGIGLAQTCFGGGSGGTGGGGDVNFTGINGVAPAVGAGAINSGTQRVTLGTGTTVGISAGAVVGIDPANDNVTVSGSVDTSGSINNSLTNDGNGNPITSTNIGGKQTLDTNPVGGATAAKQPALGTAGSSSTDVITTQGISGGTPMPVSSTDGGMSTIGAKADAAVTNPASSCSLIACTKGLLTGQALLATASAQSTANTALSNIQTNTGTIASNTASAATTTLQTAGNSSLTTIASNTTSVATTTNQTAVQGTVAAGTAASKSVLGGLIYNSTPPTATNGQGGALQGDANLNLKTTVKPAAATPKGYQQITSLSSAQTLTVPSGATMAVIICETQAVRWRDDGTNPTAAVGIPLAVGQPLMVSGNLATIAFIEQTASAKLNISYYQ